MDLPQELLRLAERFVSSCPSPALLVAPRGGESSGALRAVNGAAASVLGIEDQKPHPSVRDVLGIGWREIEVVLHDAPADLVIDLPPTSGRGARRGARVRLEPIAAAGGSLLGAIAFLDLSGPEARSPRSRSVDTLGFDALFGHDAVLLASKQAAARFAHTALPILLLAETGTGKELMARAIHVTSDRREKPFVAINCGALSPHLLESELFGYAPGAFTGASREGNEGKIGAARGGTLFLDEIAEMPGPLQSLLLRVLEDGTYYRVGENRPRQADVRLICATCRDLPRLVADGGFRQDLYYRVNGACLSLPPVRQRTDFEDLVRHLIGGLAKDLSRPEPTLAPEALDWMCTLPWAGNTRQLRTALQYALILCDGGEIRREHLPQEPGTTAMTASPGTRAVDPAAKPAPTPAPAPRTLAEREAERLQHAVDGARGNLSRAAAELGIARSTLYRRLRRHGLVEGGA